MANVSNETKEMNSTWTKKQNEIGKNYRSYYIGGFVVALVLVIVLAYLFLK